MTKRTTQVSPEMASQFDAALEQVIRELPDELLKRLREVPVVADDYPPETLMARLGISSPELLRGLHTGVPLTRRSVQHSGILPTTITVYRLGICAAAVDQTGQLRQSVLHREIRKTVLHEFGHYFGLSEDEIRNYGFA